MDPNPYLQCLESTRSSERNKMFFSLFQIDVIEHIKSRLYLAKEYNLPPSEVDKLKYYEFEIICDEIKEYNEKQKKEEDKQRKSTNQSLPDVNSMMTTMNTNMNNQMSSLRMR